MLKRDHTPKNGFDLLIIDSDVLDEETWHKVMEATALVQRVDSMEEEDMIQILKDYKYE